MTVHVLATTSNELGTRKLLKKPGSDHWLARSHDCTRKQTYIYILTHIRTYVNTNPSLPRATAAAAAAAVASADAGGKLKNE